MTQAWPGPRCDARRCRHAHPPTRGPLPHRRGKLTRLPRHAEAQALQARQKGTVSGAVRAWLLLDTLLSSGLRASEVAALRVGDCLTGCGQASMGVRQGKGDKTREGLHPGGPETTSEGLPGVAAGPWGERFGPGAGVHRPAGDTHPGRRLAGHQGAHGGRGSGSPVRHSLLPARLRHPPVAGQRGRPGGGPGAARPRQHQDHDDLREGCQGGQAEGGPRLGEDLPGLATERSNSCEVGPAPAGKCWITGPRWCDFLTRTWQPARALTSEKPTRGLAGLPDDVLAQNSLPSARLSWHPARKATGPTGCRRRAPSHYCNLIDQVRRTHLCGSLTRRASGPFCGRTLHGGSGTAGRL